MLRSIINFNVSNLFRIKLIFRWPIFLVYQYFSGSLNFAVFADGSSDFSEVAAKVVFGFAVVTFDIVVDGDISDIVVVAVGLNLLLV